MNPRSLRARFRRAIAAFFEPVAAPSIDEGALSGLDEALGLSPASSRLGPLPPADAALVAWAEGHRFFNPSLESLDEWERALAQRPLPISPLSQPARARLLELDPQGVFFFSGHQNAFDEIGAPNAARWERGYEAWSRLTLANTAEAFIDHFHLAGSGSEQLALLNLALDAPGLDWTALTPQLWAKLLSQTAWALRALSEAGQSEMEWQSLGWPLSDVAAARGLIERLERVDWPFERRFSAAEGAWLLSYFRKRGMGSPAFDALGPEPLLMELILAAEGTGPFFKTSAPIIREEPLRMGLIFERARREAELKALESCAAAGAKPPPAHRL